MSYQVSKDPIAYAVWAAWMLICFHCVAWNAWEGHYMRAVVGGVLLTPLWMFRPWAKLRGRP